MTTAGNTLISQDALSNPKIEPQQLATLSSSNNGKVQLLHSSSLVELDSVTEDTAGKDLVEESNQTVQKKVTTFIDKNKCVLLAQRPGFGKTRMMLDLLQPSRFTVVLVPTKPLEQQVCFIEKTSDVTKCNSNA